MGIVGRIMRPRAAVPTYGPEDDRSYYPGGALYGGYALTAAGVPVSSDTAMRLLTVYNCVKVLYNCVSQMPCQLMQEVSDTKSKAKEHWLYRIISKRPNSWMTAPEFWGMAIAHVSLRGNFFAYKLGVPGRPIQQLIPLKPGTVQNVVQNDDYSLTYEIMVKGQKQEIPQERMMHIRGLVTNGVMGLNPIECAAQGIALGMARDQFLSRSLGKGLHPGAVIKHPQTLNAPAYANLKAQLKEKYAGLSNSWEFMLIDEAMDITFPPVKLVDAQFLELGKFNEAQIAGMFGVPLMLIQAGDNPTTYASATEFKRTFVDLVLTPIAVNFESAIDRDCLSEKEQDRYYTKFNLNSLLRGNITERFAAYATAIDKEIMNPNECRALEDMNAYPGGNEYRTRTSTTKAPATQEAAP